MGIVGENFYSTSLAQAMEVSYDDDNIHSPHDNEFWHWVDEKMESLHN